MSDTKPIFKRINSSWVKQDAFQRISGAWVRISSKEEVTEDTLAGTWVFNNNPDLSGSGSIDVNINFTSNERDFTSISIIKGSSFGSAIQYDGLEVYTGSIGWSINEAYKTIMITSKLSEVTNGDTLLAWLQANATKQTTTTPTLINFTIAGTSYQAEEGMTWEQWVNSSYNTGSFIVYNNCISTGSGAAGGSRVTTDSAYNDAVSSTDIIAAAAYYFGAAK